MENINPVNLWFAITKRRPFANGKFRKLLKQVKKKSFKARSTGEVCRESIHIKIIQFGSQFSIPNTSDSIAGLQ
jgi:hypothetical protein